MEFMTESGDVYGKPDDTEEEVAAYRAAVDRGDYDYVMKVEEGETGWRFVRSG